MLARLSIKLITIALSLVLQARGLRNFPGPQAPFSFLFSTFVAFHPGRRDLIKKSALACECLQLKHILSMEAAVFSIYICIHTIYIYIYIIWFLLFAFASVLI